MLQPQAPELEETILGACLIEKEGMALVDELLKPEMFYVTRHQLIYAALQAMFHAGTNIDILTATEELRKRGAIDLLAIFTCRAAGWQVRHIWNIMRASCTRSTSEEK